MYYTQRRLWHDLLAGYLEYQGDQWIRLPDIVLVLRGDAVLETGEEGVVAAREAAVTLADAAQPQHQQCHKCEVIKM